MNYLAALLGLALMGAITTTAVYRADAIDYKAKYQNLISSSQLAAQKAKDDAQREIDAAKADNDKKRQSALDTHAADLKQIDSMQADYSAKLAILQKQQPKDIPHLCAVTPLPSDLRP